MVNQYLDLQVPLAMMAVLESWDKQDLKAKEVIEETLVREVRMVNPVSVVHQDYKEKKVLLDHQELMDSLVAKESLVLLAHRVLLGYKVPLA
jgi:hypothetical protein